MASVPRLLSGLYNGLVGLWAFVRNLFARHHTLFFATYFFLTLRFGIWFTSLLFTSIYHFARLARVAAQAGNSHTAGLSILTGFSLVNSMFPVYELFVFLGTLLTLKSAALLYAFLRTLYKSIPFKAT